jgi:hypothetical protein
MKSVTSEPTIEGLGAAIVELRFLDPRATRCVVEAMRRSSGLHRRGRALSGRGCLIGAEPEKNPSRYRDQEHARNNERGSRRNLRGARQGGPGPGFRVAEPGLNALGFEG